MAKELPYFRFYPQEWQNGDITLESLEQQGLFMNICAYYWISDCNVRLKTLEKRFKETESLFESEILHKDGDFLMIKFLDKQFEELHEYREKKRIAGRKGGLKRVSNTKEVLKHNSTIKEKKKENEKNSSITKAELDLPTKKDIAEFKAHMKKVLS